MDSIEAFDDRHRETLEHVLGRERREEPPLSYPQIAGFLYAVAAAPSTVLPSKWWPAALGDGGPPMPDDADVPAFSAALMALKNFATEQVFAEIPAFAPGCEPPDTVANAFGPAPFGQWVEGLIGGHAWLQDDWDAALDEDGGEAIDEALTALSVFMNRSVPEAMLADAALPEEEPRPTVEELAIAALPVVDEALATYMSMARQALLAERRREANVEADSDAAAPDADDR